MGLDMYLSASKYLPGWPHNSAEDRAQLDRVLEGAGLSAAVLAEGSPSATLKVNVAYWRKANAIHRWFVDNVQGGNDNCEEWAVSRDKLIELQGKVDTVLGGIVFGEEVTEVGMFGPYTYTPLVSIDIELATTELPPQEGFFFGSTELDDGYGQDLLETKRQLDAILGNEMFEGIGVDFYYQSSW